MANNLGVLEHIGDIELSDQIHFNFDSQNLISIEDVIIHLQGLEKISRKVPFLLEKILEAKNIKGVSLKYSQLEIERIQAGSLSDFIKLKLEAMFAGEANPELKQKVWKEIENMKPGMFISLLIGAVAVGAICTKCSTQAPPASFTGVNQSFVINIASTFNVSEDKVSPLLQETAKKSTAEDVRAGIHFFRPAKRAGGDIRFSEGQPMAVEVKKDFINDTPEDYVPPTNSEVIQSFKQVSIDIRALDMDNLEKGWYAIIPVVSGRKRIKIELGSEVDPMALSKLSVTGDVDVVYKVDSKGKKTVVKAFLNKIK